MATGSIAVRLRLLLSGAAALASRLAARVLPKGSSRQAGAFEARGHRRRGWEDEDRKDEEGGQPWRGAAAGKDEDKDRWWYTENRPNS